MSTNQPIERSQESGLHQSTIRQTTQKATWKTVLWTDETKQPNNVYQHKNLISSVKHDDDNILTLQENVKMSIHELKLNRTWIMQQDSNTKQFLLREVKASKRLK